MENQTGITACPFCHGEIKQGAIKCKHCKKFISDPAPSVADTSVRQNSCELIEKLKGCDSFVLKGWRGDQLVIVKNGTQIAYLRMQKLEGSEVYELVENENDPTPAFRYVRTEQTICGQADNGSEPLFTWQNGKSLGGEIVSGSKWKCGNLLLSASGIREFLMWLPTISWFVASKYTIQDNGCTIATITGACLTFTNAKTVKLNDSSRLLEVLAAAIILSSDAIG